MRARTFYWLGQQFIELMGEARADLGPAEAARELFGRFERELKASGLSLDDTVRTRLYGRTRADRDGGSGERFKLLSGKARSASSSYIAPRIFDSEASVALDLLAMRPPQPGAQKTLVEYEPPIVPLRYLVYGNVVFLSGMTSVLPTLDEQVAEIFPNVLSALEHAKVGLQNVAHVSIHLHSSEKLDHMEKLLRERLGPAGPALEFATVEGYSTPGKLVEIEVTAVR